MKRLVILGAGPAGLFAAAELIHRFPGLHITVIEAEEQPGGITGSFEWRGLTFDYGSHRLHPATSPELLSRISDLLGKHLLKRPRHGRILLLDRLISFPLKPVELLVKLPIFFSAGVVRDMITAPFRTPGKDASFSETLSAGLGKTISRHFYFPYAEKLWGLPPEKISPVQARRRIASGSTWKMAGKALLSILGREKSKGYFYYPLKGFGEIACRAAEKLKSDGVMLRFKSRAVSVTAPGKNQPGVVTLEGGETVSADFILSTIPVSSLLNAMGEQVPPETATAAEKLKSRAMVFLYLELEGARYTEYDAHYFPGSEYCFSRMSEPKNYAATGKPEHRTGLCFEIPCNENDSVWNSSADELKDTVLRQLEKTGLPAPAVTGCTIRRKRFIYPVYDMEFQHRIDTVQHWLLSQKGIVSLGRQGLFAHDNTHHSMETGIKAAECLDEALNWNGELWLEKLEEFKSHVVVD